MSAIPEIPLRRLCFLLWFGSCILVASTWAQTTQEETLSGPDSHETGQGQLDHLFGDWGGIRSRLQERGINLDLHYISDSLWNIKSVQPERLVSWNRFFSMEILDDQSISHGRASCSSHSLACTPTPLRCRASWQSASGSCRSGDPQSSPGG